MNCLLRLLYTWHNRSPYKSKPVAHVRLHCAINLCHVTIAQNIERGMLTLCWATSANSRLKIDKKCKHLDILCKCIARLWMSHCANRYQLFCETYWLSDMVCVLQNSMASVYVFFLWNKYALRNWTNESMWFEFLCMNDDE